MRSWRGFNFDVLQNALSQFVSEHSGDIFDTSLDLDVKYRRRLLSVTHMIDCLNVSGLNITVPVTVGNAQFRNTSFQ